MDVEADILREAMLEIYRAAADEKRVRTLVAQALDDIEDVTPLRTASKPDGGSGGNVVDFRPRTGGNGPAAA